MANAPRGHRPIGDYAIIGDAHTAALVASDGSIDWCCCPRFDSPAVFCRLLDAQNGGYWSIAPVEPYRSSRQYAGWTNVLATTFVTENGRVRVTDFMPIRQRDASRRGEDVAASHRLLRLIEGLSGSVECEVRFRPTFGFASVQTVVQPCEGGAVASGEGESLALGCPIPLHNDTSASVSGRRRVRTGDRLWIAMTYRAGDPTASDFLVDDSDSQLDKTLQYWRGWSDRCSYHGPYHALVRRSALMLKLLIYEPTGAIIAAPTTSLPAEIGGVRNWDYRYTWLRDAALILYALQSIGYYEEAADFFEWIERLCVRCRGDLRIMYRIDGGEDLDERNLEHLHGYRGSRPVRVGNAAARQRQLDVYGPIMDAAHLYFEAEERKLDPEFWGTLRYVADQAATRWREADQGLWEVRGPPQHFLYSKLQCWVALDRALRLAHLERVPADTSRWQRARDEIRSAILNEGYDRQTGAFTQAFGSRVLDASALAIPLVEFLPANDPRVLSTIERIRERLTSNGLVYRYHAAETDDGLAGTDASFAMCTFWLVDNLALLGRINEARSVFERVTGYANDVGLLSEEIDPAGGQLLGNYPQGYTHLALIRSALRIAKAESSAGADRKTTRRRSPA